MKNFYSIYFKYDNMTMDDVKKFDKAVNHKGWLENADGSLYTCNQIKTKEDVIFCINLVKKMFNVKISIDDIFYNTLEGSYCEEEDLNKEDYNFFKSILEKTIKVAITESSEEHTTSNGIVKSNQEDNASTTITDTNLYHPSITPMSKLKVGMKLKFSKTNNIYTVKQISTSHNKAYLQQENNTIDIPESHSLSKIEELLQTGYYTIIEDTKQGILY